MQQLIQYICTAIIADALVQNLLLLLTSLMQMLSNIFESYHSSIPCCFPELLLLLLAAQQRCPTVGCFCSNLSRSCGIRLRLLTFSKVSNNKDNSSL